jgi:hypothetical protein
MSVANLQAMAVGAACPWSISDAENMAECESHRAKRDNATAAAAAASSAAATAAAAAAVAEPTSDGE